MRSYYSTDRIRVAEAAAMAELPDGALMRRAAHGLATVLASELRERTGGVAGRRVTLLVGSGDNGGDALWAGALLRRRGVAVDAILLKPDRAHPEGLAALRKAGGRITDSVDDADLVVDGIVGISGHGALRSDAAELVATVTAPIVAVDLPSGVDPATGAVDGPAVNAAVTVAFGALKPVHALAAPHCGRIELVPIGLQLDDGDLRSLDPAEVGRRWPVPGPDDDKYSQGVTGVCAGSKTYPGAAVLCVGAAVAATSGMVRYAGTGSAEVVGHWPEVIAASSVAESGRVQAWVIGPGFGTDDAAYDTLDDVLGTGLPVLVDADGLTMLAADPDLVRGRTAPTLLTPHAGEFERLTGSAPSADRVESVRALAQDWEVTVLLKGRATLVAGADGSVLVNEAGGSWASTAGAGDVLSGIIGSLLAAGIDPVHAAAMGAKAHALAANLAAHRTSVTGAPVSAEPLLGQVRTAVGVLRDLADVDAPKGR